MRNSICLQGLPQKIDISFDEAALLSPDSRLEIRFQGGFVGSVLHLTLGGSAEKITHQKSFYPDDVNNLQAFPLELNEAIAVRRVTILFEQSSDFFGRIIVYELRLIS